LPDHDWNGGAAERMKPTYDAVELIVESETDADHHHVVEEAANAVEHEETGDWHPESARNRRGKQGQPRNKFRDDQGFPPEPLKGCFCFAHAGIGRQRERA